MQKIRINTSQNIDIDFQLAGIGDRFLARIIDYVIFFGAFFVIAIFVTIMAAVTQTFRTTGNTSLIVMLVIFLSFYVFYDLVCEIFFNGQSIGKRALKIRVVSLQGGRPTITQYLLRWVFRAIDFGITAGYCALLCVSLSKKRQRVGDMVAATVVVTTESYEKFAGLVFTPVEEEYDVQYAAVAQLNDDDVVLIHDVIKNFNRTRNSDLVYRLAVKIKRHLHIFTPAELNEYQFLEVVLRDYKHLTARG